MMRRGEIYYANLDPTIGAEIKKKRPVLIISNNANNRVSSNITILAITSNINKVYPFEVLLEPKISGLHKKCKAQCQQIRTISKLRICSKLKGQVNSKTLQEVEEALKIHLDIAE